MVIKMLQLQIDLLNQTKIIYRPPQLIKMISNDKIEQTQIIEYNQKKKFVDEVVHLNLDFHKEKQWMNIINRSCLGRLNFLSLRQCAISDTHFQTMANKYWPSLRTLDLSQNKLTSKSCHHFSVNKFPQLSFLFLCGNPIGNEGLQIIWAIRRQKMIEMDLSVTGINKFGKCHLLNSTNQIHAMLCILRLNGNKIGTNGIKILIKVNLPQLRSLQLSDCSIGNEGVKYLSKNNWERLRQLYLNYNSFGLDGQLQIKKYRLGNIREFSVERENEGKGTIREAIGAIDLIKSMPYQVKTRFRIENVQMCNSLQEASRDKKNIRVYNGL